MNRKSKPGPFVNVTSWISQKSTRSTWVLASGFVSQVLHLCNSNDNNPNGQRLILQLLNSNPGEMSELRQRPTATSKSSNGPDKEPNPRQHTINDETDQDHGISLLDIIRVIVTLLIACGGLSYYMTSSESVLWGYRPWYTRWPVVKQWVVCKSRSSKRVTSNSS